MRLLDATLIFARLFKLFVSNGVWINARAMLSSQKWLTYLVHPVSHIDDIEAYETIRQAVNASHDVRLY